MLPGNCSWPFEDKGKLCKRIIIKFYNKNNNQLPP